MNVWENIINQDFATEKEVDVTRFFKVVSGKRLFVTVKEIDGINARKLVPFEGRLMTQTDGLLITQFTNQYDKKQEDLWKTKFENGINYEKNNLKEIFGNTFIMDFGFWEECARKIPALFKFIELEIDSMNNRTEPTGADKKEVELKKKKLK